MSEEGKFQHIDKWLGPRIVSYNSSYSNMRGACDAAEENSSELPLLERIDLIDITQRLWMLYARCAVNTAKSIGEYIGMMEHLGEQEADLVKLAKEKRQIIESDRIKLMHKFTGLSALRTGLTKKYLEQEGLV